jgi:hypothetical protein
MEEVLQEIWMPNPSAVLTVHSDESLLEQQESSLALAELSNSFIAQHMPSQPEPSGIHASLSLPLEPMRMSLHLGSSLSLSLSLLL